MSNVGRWLLGVLGLFLLAPLGSCASVPPAPNRTVAVDPISGRLEIDLSAGLARTEDWTSPAVDCSDEHYICISIPDRMALAFPRTCSEASRDLPPTAFGALRRVAPMPHLQPPSGSYVVEAFPRVLMFYYARDGLFEVRELVHSPYESEFNPSDFVAEWVVSAPDGSSLLACK